MYCTTVVVEISLHLPEMVSFLNQSGVWYNLENDYEPPGVFPVCPVPEADPGLIRQSTFKDFSK